MTVVVLCSQTCDCRCVVFTDVLHPRQGGVQPDPLPTPGPHGRGHGWPRGGGDHDGTGQSDHRSVIGHVHFITLIVLVRYSLLSERCHIG